MKASAERKSFRPPAYDIGRYASFPVEVQVGGATIFVLDVENS